MHLPVVAVQFRIGGPSHWAALAVTVIVGALMVALARAAGCATARRWCERSFAVLLAVLPFVRLIEAARTGVFEIQRDLPLQFCDFAAAAGAIALWTRRQRFAEATYFAGLAGTMQGLITPALQEDFPSRWYFLFFVGHGAIVIASLYVVAGMRLLPQPGAVRRMMTASTVFALVIGALNAAMGTNYGFLCRKSPNPSLLDMLGPWPWYVAVLWLLALVIYTLLWLPFLCREASAPRHAPL